MRDDYRTVSPPVDFEEILAQTAWMTALARSLTGDEHTADDLVQETWIAALRRPPGERAAIRSWLAVVMRNALRQRDRGDARRSSRERSHAPRERIEDANTLVERAEMHRRVVNALMALSEPTRSTLLRRYFDGQGVKEIARTEGVPHETIKSRLKRGLAQLRGALDKSFGSRSTWMAAIVVLTGGATATAAPTVSITDAAAAVKTVGTATATKGIAVAAVLVTAVAVTLPHVRGDDPPPMPAEDPISPPTTDPTDHSRGARTVPHPVPRTPKSRPSDLPRKTTPPKPRDERRPNPADATKRPIRIAPPGGSTPDPETLVTNLDERRRMIPTGKPSRALRRAFREWVQLKDTSNLRELKRLKRIEPTLQRLVAKLGKDRLKKVGLWSELLRMRDDRSARRVSGRKGFPISRDDHVQYHIYVPKKRPADGYTIVLRLSDGPERENARSFREAWGNREPDAVVFAPIQPRPKPPKRGEKAPPPFAWSARKDLVHSLGALSHVRGDTMHDALALQTNHDALFLEGTGDSAVQAWKMADDFASLFAGIVIRGALPPKGIRFEDFRNTPFLLISEPGRDLTPDAASALGRTMKKAGVDVTIVAVPADKPAAIRKRTIDKAIDRFLEKRRDPYPLAIDWSVKETHSRQSFWIKSLNEIEDETLPAKQRGRRPVFSVRVDQKTNTIAIRSHRIEKFLVYLNDALVDLDRPVTIVINGKVVFRGKRERSFEELIDNWEIFGDYTAVFPASIEVEVPARAAKRAGTKRATPPR